MSAAEQVPLKPLQTLYFDVLDPARQQQVVDFSRQLMDEQFEQNPRPTSEPIVCQPWCEAGDGHTKVPVRQEQVCVGVEHKVPLSTEPTELRGDSLTTWSEPQYLTTYLQQGADETCARVFIGKGEDAGSLATWHEARQFALHIFALVEQGRAQE